MRLLIVFLLLSSFIILSPFGYGQQQKGDKEVQVAGSYYSSVGTDFNMSFGLIQGKFGYYFTDNLELGVSPQLNIFTAGNSTDTKFGAGIFGNYCFLTSNAKMVPYAGMQIYIPDFDNTDFTYMNISGGAKYFITERTAFDGSLNYGFSLSSDVEGGIFLLAFGISYLF